MGEKSFRNHVKNETIQVDYDFHPGCLVEMKVTVSPVATIAAHHKAAKEIRKEVSLPGFRKGKIPDEILSKHFADEIEKHTTDILRSTAFKDASDLINRPPLSKYVRKATLSNISEEQGSSLFFEYEAEPQIPQVDLKTINLQPVQAIEPSEKEVDLFLLRIRFSWSKKTPISDRAVQKGDAVTLSLTALFDGKEKVVEAEKELLITEDLFPEWLFQAILNMKAGEKKEIAHPDDKNSDGSPVMFTINVSSVSECELIAEDAEFAAKWHFPSVLEFREYIKNTLRLRHKAIAQEKMRKQLKNEFIRLYAFDLPQTLVESETEGRYKAYTTAQTSLKEGNPGTGREIERKTFLDEVKRYFTCFFLMKQFFPQVDQSISQEDFGKEFEQQVSTVPYPQRIITPGMDEKELLYRLMTSLVLKRVEDFCIKEIFGVDPMTQVQQKELAESVFSDELHEKNSIGESQTISHQP